MAGFSLTTDSVSIPYKQISGGLNSTANPLTLQENESPDLQNIDFDRFGSFLKRNGYAALNTSAFNGGATWTSLHWLELSSGTQMLIGSCGNKLAQMNSLDGTWNDITGTLTVTAGNNNFFDWTTFIDTALGTNNVDVPVKYTGSGNASAMTVPTGLTKAKFVKTFQNYTLLANVTVSGTTSPSRIYWSAVGSISTWTASDNADISPNDGQTITGLRVLGDKLVIYKDRSIWVGLFTGDRDIPFIFQPTPSSVGADSHWSIQEAENGHIFHYQDGFYFFDGNNSQKLSDRITTTLIGYAQNRYPQIVSCYQREKNKYWSSFTTSGGSTHNRVITFDTYNNAFSLYNGINANCYAIVYTSGQNRVYFGDYLGFVYRADTGSNDNPSNTATAINGYFYTKWFDEGDLVNQKGVPEALLYYDYNTGTNTFSYSYDLENADTYNQTFVTTAPGVNWDSGIWDVDKWGSTGGSFTRLDLVGRGRLVRMKVSNSNSGETFKINAIGKVEYLETNV